MWCYQKPGFEALLLAELQKQQQCSQFCDTLLKADGVSVPAHSCVLSAISPYVSSALTSSPAPPAGQSRLLEFQALGACTLLHMVRLLYSGEMAGEGEKEKQEAVSAAAKLGIHGLVEVTKSDRKSRNEEGGGQCTEVGVQTEPLMLEENEDRWGSRWRREVRDGSTFLWRETLSGGEKDMRTQTKELQVNRAPPTHSAASCETTDMAALQGLAQTHSHLVPSQIPYVPISLVYPPEENQTPQHSSAPAASIQIGHTSVAVVAPPYTSVPMSLLPFSNQTTLCAADPQSWWTGPQGAAGDNTEGEEWEDERLEQFQGNIPGFINYFLNPNKENGPCRGRPGQRHGAGVGGARRAGSGERRARRPRARTGGRGRGGLTQTVDVQDVGVSRLQKVFLQRWGMRTSRTGQGGGAAGRKLYLKTRELLTPAKSQRVRRRGKVWEISQSGDLLLHNEGGGGGGGGGGNTQRGRRSTTQQSKQDSLPAGWAQSTRAKTSTSVSFSSTPMQFYNVHTLSSSSLQPSPSPILLSPAASSLLHTTSLPPPAPPPHEDQPEHIDRLLEEVMMGLDILPNNNNSQPPLPASSSSCTNASPGNNLAKSKQQGCTTGPQEAAPGFHGSTQVVAVARGTGGSTSENGETPVLQQQGEGELNVMLDHFLQSFEQHVDNCSARDEEEVDGDSSTEASKLYTVLNKHRKPTTRTKTPHVQNTHIQCPVIHSQTAELQQSDKAETPASRSNPQKASARSSQNAEGAPETVGEQAKRQKRRRKKQYLLSLERKKVWVKKPVSTSDPKSKILQDQGDKQLQWRPVVELERSGPLPVRVTLQEHSSQSLEVKNPVKAKCSSSSVKHSSGSLSEKSQLVLCGRKIYPIRSRFKEANIMDSMPFLKEPFVRKQPDTAGQPNRGRGRSKKNGQLLSLSNDGSSTPPNQQQPAESCGTNKREKNQERHEEEMTVQPQEEAEEPTGRRKKRGAESEEETSVDATVAKRVCFEKMSETCVPSCQSVDSLSEQATIETEDGIDVETVSLTSVGDRDQEVKPVSREIKLRETEESLTGEEVEGSGDEIIDVDGDADPEERTDDCREHSESTSLSVKEASVRSTGSWEDDDIDVIGGSSPAPDPVIINWTESSEGEEDEADDYVDVVGEKMGCASSVVFATMNEGELVNRQFMTEVLH